MICQLRVSYTNLGALLRYGSIVTNPKNDYIVIQKPIGYCLINAYNGDRDANPVSITSIQKQGNQYILFLPQVVNGNMRVEIVWMKTDFYQ